MIVVCTKERNNLTIGKQYNVIVIKSNYEWDLVADDYLLLNDADKEDIVCENYFITLDEWRSKQLKKLSI